MIEKNLMSDDKFTTYYGEFRLQDWLLNFKFSAGAKMTFATLTCCSGGNTHTWVSQKYLAEKLSVSVRTIQRYLNELIENKLIKKTHQYIRGQFRCVYYFLALKFEKFKQFIKPKIEVKTEDNKLLSLENTKISTNNKPISKQPLAEKEATNPPESEATNCRPPSDNLSPLSYKVESNIKENKISPLPPKKIIQAKEIFKVKEKFIGGDVIKFKTKENLLSENHIWSEIKINLQEELSLKEINTWFEPIIFEYSSTETILRVPNNFFKNWLKSNFEEIINIALKSKDILSWRLEIYTEKQQKVFENYLKNIELQKEKEKEKEKNIKQEKISYKNFSKEEQFELLAKEYPVKVGLWKAKKTFFNLLERKEFENFQILINAIKKAKKTESWNKDKGRWIPSLTKWLTEHRWEDCQR